MKSYDAVIIGFGKGGKTLAGMFAAAGKSVAVIEQSKKMYGGTCINVGCIPSKSLVHSARLSFLQGGDFLEKARRYKEAIQEKDRLTGKLRQKNYDKLNDNPQITVIDGRASFQSANRILVESDGGAEIFEGRQIFINSGARPFIPPIKGLRESKFNYISETLLDLETLPRRLVIIGGGYIGMEFASMYANFGSKVTVVQDGSRFLPREDTEIADAVLERLLAQGVRIILSSEVESIQDGDTAALISVKVGEKTEILPAEAILTATGRRPNVEGLNLAAAGVELTERGGIKADERLRTTVPHIWAMGDVTGGLQFTYISLDDFRIVRSQIFGDGKRTTENRGAVPYSVFLDPPFSRVGMSEQEAAAQGYEVKIARLSAAAIPKAQVIHQPAGLLKAVVDAKTDRILGAHFFCAESHEMINIIKLAIDAKLPYIVLRDNIYTHPTMSEALNDLFASLS